ncbi:MAG TPA: CPBP family intramembrane glutamic endopeptidase [Gemmatimonadales bacterium]|nr:CPBP family intramembrane glutamic endopeptidase [Gemmatimonadales bacterium]
MPIGFAGIFHLVFFGLFLPWAAFRSGRQFATSPLPPRPQLFVSVIINQVIFVALSLLVAWREEIPLFPSLSLQPGALALGAGMLAVGFAILGPHMRQSVQRRERKLHMSMPRTRRERRLWAGVSLAAGIGEEVTYRGVMFTLLSRLWEDPIAAAIVAAALFGFSHILQGWKSAGIVGVVALALQGIVILSGSLYIVIAMHAIYDLVAGLTCGKLGEQLGYPAEGIEVPTPGAASPAQ